MARITRRRRPEGSDGPAPAPTGRRDFLRKLGISATAVAALQAVRTDPALAELEVGFEEMVDKMGDRFDPFPEAGIDGFLSHFNMMIEFLQGPLTGQTVPLQMPMAIQSVSRSEPFVYAGSNPDFAVKVPLPPDCTLSDTITESTFINRPDEFFTPGRETVWMQILNLDARMDHPQLGPVRIMLGETLKREHPDVFLPSLGIAQSLGTSRFPSRLFFNPYALIETQFGTFRAIHGTLSYGWVTSFPPITGAISIAKCIPLERVEDVRKLSNLHEIAGNPIARIVALAHPIDVSMQIPGEEAFAMVERRVALA